MQTLFQGVGNGNSGSSNPDALAGSTASNGRRTTSANIFEEANDEMQAFKWLLDRAEEENDILYSFSKRQVDIFEQTKKEMEKITQKTNAGSTPALKRFGDCDYSSLKRSIDSVLALPNELADHLRRFLLEYEQQVLAPLSLVREGYKTRLRSLRTEVKSSWGAYVDMRDGAIPKLKRLYLKQAEELEIARNRDQSVAKNLAAVTKAKQDLKNADCGYRLGIQMLEDRRLSFIDTMDRVKGQLYESETERTAGMRACILSYSKLFDELRASDAVVCSNSKAAAVGIDVASDAQRFVADVAVAFPTPEKVLFDHPIAGPLRDLIFGISLRSIAEKQGTLIPTLVEQLILAIEERGLEAEGLYRISGRVSETEQMRISIEKNSDNMSLFFDSSTDIHCLTGLMKAYFRELPEPVFVWDLLDRMDYLKIQNTKQRLANLRARVAQQCAANKELLRRIIGHLSRVASYSATNKMTTSNLARIWSTLIFSSTATSSSSHVLSHSASSLTSASQTNLTSTGSGLAGLMRKAAFHHGGSASSSNAGADGVSSKLQYNLDDQYAAEMAAGDSLVEDLITYYSDIFPEAVAPAAAKKKASVEEEPLPALPERVEPKVEAYFSRKADLMKSLPPPPLSQSLPKPTLDDLQNAAGLNTSAPATGLLPEDECSFSSSHHSAATVPIDDRRLPNDASSVFGTRQECANPSLQADEASANVERDPLNGTSTSYSPNFLANASYILGADVGFETVLDPLDSRADASTAQSVSSASRSERVDADYKAGVGSGREETQTAKSTSERSATRQDPRARYSRAYLQRANTYSHSHSPVDESPNYKADSSLVDNYARVDVQPLVTSQRGRSSSSPSKQLDPLVNLD